MSVDRINARLPGALADHVAFVTGEGAYYENSSEYVRDLIRRDMQRAAAIAELREELEIGRKSGKPRPFDSERIRRQGMKKLQMRHGAAGE